MNTLLRSSVVAALCVASAMAQAPDAAAALARAQLLEHQETDLAAAEQAYRALLADAAATAAHGEAALHLGTLLWRLDRKDAGKPFLDRAVAAGGDLAARATAVLQGQGEDGKLAQQRLEKARALVALYQELTERPRDDKGALDDDTSRRLRDVTKDLRWLGAEAAQAIVEALHKLDDVKKNQSGSWGPGKEASRKGLARHLWQIGTAPAVAALNEWSQSPDVGLRRAIAEGTNRTNVASDLEPVLLTFVRDPDPTGEVWRAVLDSVKKLAPQLHRQLAGDAHPALAAAGLQGLAYTWQELSAADREQVVDQLGPAIRRATTTDDARLAQAAWRLLKAFADFGPRRAQSLFLAEAHRYPADLGGFDRQAMPPVDDAWLGELRAAGQRVGKQSETPPRGDDAATAITVFLTRGQASWTAAGVDDALALVELGYGTGKGYDAQWPSRCLPLATADQLARLVRALPGIAEPNRLIQGLVEAQLPVALFAALRDVVEACLGDHAPPWSTQRGGQTRIVRGRHINTSGPNDLVLMLCHAIAKTRAPEAAAWFVQCIDRDATLAPVAANLLVVMSGNGVGAPAHAALRTLLVWPGTDQNELQPHERSQVFAELARIGDVAAIPLFPRAHELGLQRTGIPDADGGFQGAGIGFLGERKDFGRRAPSGPWHGYADQDLLAAWRTLLESPAADAVWYELIHGEVLPGSGATKRPNSNMRRFEIPQAVLPLLCEHLPRRWAAASAETKDELYRNVLSPFRQLRPGAVAGDSVLGNALRTLLTSDAGDLPLYVFASLPADVGAVFADEARLALRRAPSKHWIHHLVRAGIELPLDEWRGLLGILTPSLDDVLRAIPPQPAAALRREVEATLQHDQKEVRMAACQAMQRLYATDAVPSLLPLLQDADDDVRKAARAGLDQLREEHERRRFWADAGSGIDLSPAGAAARLLAQAKTGEAKEQRLLAIRSLAVLAAAESLPYLIELTKEADAEIAAAARAAVTQIHQASPGRK